jgi:hypothetical protein
MGCGCKKNNAAPAPQPATIRINEVPTPAPTSIPGVPQQ